MSEPDTSSLQKKAALLVTMDMTVEMLNLSQILKTEAYTGDGHPERCVQIFERLASLSSSACRSLQDHIAGYEFSHSDICDLFTRIVIKTQVSAPIPAPFGELTDQFITGEFWDFLEKPELLEPRIDQFMSRFDHENKSNLFSPPQP